MLIKLLFAIAVACVPFAIACLFVGVAADDYDAAEPYMRKAATSVVLCIACVAVAIIILILGA